jgi:ParB-like chromosome segregation protein Spo0J
MRTGNRRSDSTRVSIDKAGGRVAVIYRPIAELNLDPNNPRLHTPRQVRQIARSVEAFGFNVPVLVDANLKVIAGAGRLMACQLLGWSEVPTICLQHLSDAQAKRAGGAKAIQNIAIETASRARAAPARGIFEPAIVPPPVTDG